MHGCELAKESRHHGRPLSLPGSLGPASPSPDVGADERPLRVSACFAGPRTELFSTKRASILMLVTWLGPLVAFIYGFHLSYQVYVLQLDVILASVGLGSLMLEAVLIAVLGLVLAENLAAWSLGLGFCGQCDQSVWCYSWAAVPQWLRELCWVCCICPWSQALHFLIKTNPLQ
eukprot:s55_g5.t1